MSLVWGTPLALLLASLLVGPLLAHMIRRMPNERRPFGAMLLLNRLPERLRRRRTLEDKALLLLRMLLVAAVVLAVARPEVQWPGAVPEFGGSGAVVVVLDDSLSMDLRAEGEGTLLSRARADAIDMVRALPSSTLVGAVRIGGGASRLTASLTQDHGEVISVLSSVQQTPFGTDLVGGIRLARQMLAGEGGEVLVYTDEAGRGVVDGSLPEIALLTEQGGALVPRPIHAENPANVAVVGAQYGSGPEGGTVTIEIANFGPEPVEVPATLFLPDGNTITAFVDVPPGETAEEAFTVPRVSEGGVGTVRIDDGRLAADDVGSFHLPSIGASRVLVVDGDPGLTPVASEVYYLERALAPWGRSSAGGFGVLPDITAPSGVQSLDPEVHRVVFLANVADPGPWANRLVEFVQLGGVLVMSVGNNVSADRTNSVLASLLPTPLRRPRSLVGPGERGLSTIAPDGEEPMFAPFLRGGMDGFARIRWNQLFTVEPYKDSDEVRTLLRVEGGMPLLIERRVGAGRVLLFTGTMDADWGTFPLQAVYMPIIQSLVRVLGVPAGAADLEHTGIVGQPLELRLPGSLAEVSVQGPNGPVEAVVEGGMVRMTPLVAGAHYVLSPGMPAMASIAVNVDVAESDVRRHRTLAQTAATIDPERFMHRLELHRWALWFALALAVLQAIFAWDLVRKKEVSDVE
jgi:hypothetical protein